MRLALALAATVLSFAVSAAPVAFVADLQGNASIEGQGKVGFLTELNAGTRLMLGTGATVAVTYAATGTEFTLRGPGEFVVAESEVKAEKGAAPTKRQVSSLKDLGVVARVSKTATASIRMRNVTPGGPAKNALDYPVDTKIATLQPELRWTQLSRDGAEVKLLDASGKELWKGQAQSGAARPAVKLSAASRYRWTVMTPGGVVGEAQFETVSADALMKVAKSKSGKGFSERVMHAFVLHDVGATQEARAAWAELAKERPDLPELAALARQSP